MPGNNSFLARQSTFSSPWSMFIEKNRGEENSKFTHNAASCYLHDEGNGMRWSTRKQGDNAQQQGDKRQQGNWSTPPTSPSTLRPSPSSDAGTVLLGATGRAGEQRRGEGGEREQLVEAQDGEMA